MLLLLPCPVPCPAPRTLSYDFEAAAAHEIGHLMGGHHHQANCVESLLNIGGSPCTLMFNFIDLQSTAFSLLNGIVVRGHGQAYAVP